MILSKCNSVSYQGILRNIIDFPIEVSPMPGTIDLPHFFLLSGISKHIDIRTLSLSDVNSLFNMSEFILANDAF